jgi:glycosyltransferase involved in cell wall biosynthesis
MKEAKKCGVPIRILHSHSAISSDKPIKRLRNRILSMRNYKFTSCFIACSENAARSTFKKIKDKIIIVHNGVDVNRFAYNENLRKSVRKDLGIEEKELCIGNVSRFTLLKNHKYLIDVFSLICEKMDCRLVLIGDGELEEQIRRYVKNKELNEKVLFLGRQSNCECYYQAFDVFVMPSISEGFGLAALEAQCSGLPCVLSTGVPRTVAVDENCVFLPISSHRIWAEEIMRFYKSERIDKSEKIRCQGLDSLNIANIISSIYID